MKIKYKLLFLFFVPSTIFALAISLVLGIYTRRTILAEAHSQLEISASSRANEINTFFQENINQLKLITSRTKLRNTLANYLETQEKENIGTINSILSDAQAPLPKISRLCILDPTGKVIASTDESYLGIDASKKNFFQQGLTKEGVYLVEDRGKRKVYVVGPLNLEQQPLGVGIMVLDLYPLNQIVSDRTGLGGTGEILTAIRDDQTEEIVFLTDRLFSDDLSQHDQNIESENKAQPMKEALLGQEKFVSSSNDYRGEKVTAVTKYLPTYELGLVAKIDEQELEAPLVNLLRMRLLVTLSALALFYLAAIPLSLSITRPIGKLTKGVQELAQGHYDYKINLSGKSELAKLAQGVNDLSQKVKSAQQEAKQKASQQTDDIAQKNKKLREQRLAMMNVLEDVEAEKQHAEEQSQELEKFKLAVDNASDHIVITDPDGIALYCNQAAEEITGYSAQEIIGQKVGTKDNWGGLMEPQVYDELWETIKGKGEVYSGEITNKRKNGQEYVALASISPILDNEGNPQFFVGIERDITKLKEVDRMKTEFISLASHQLRTPLSAMRWFLEMLLAGDAGELNQQQKEFVQNIDESNKRMIDLVNALLNISRIESGRIIIEPQPIRLEDLLDSVAKEMRPELEKKKQELIISVNKELPEINLDEKLIRNVFINLLTNAHKYSQEESTISVFVSRKDDNALIQVADEGRGIPAKDQDKIFDKFFRATNAVESDAGGTGLGLYLVKKIVEASAGQVWFESTEGQGTSFWISLPLAGCEAQEGEVRIS